MKFNRWTLVLLTCARITMLLALVFSQFGAVLSPVSAAGIEPPAVVTSVNAYDYVPANVLTQADGLPCPTWNLFNDFRSAPSQENPNRDSCGNLDVWYFLRSNDLSRIPSTYEALSIFIPDIYGLDGYDAWVGEQDNFPGIGKNTGQQSDPLVPQNSLLSHPAPTQMAIVGWRSPITGTVEISGSMTDMDPACGDGILWYIDKGSANLTSGAVNGTSQNFSSGTGSSNLTHVSVDQGDFIYFAIHPGAGYACDTTRFDITITQSASPTVTVEQALDQADPTNDYTIDFIATFSEPINVSSFTDADITLGGTDPGSLSKVINEVSPLDGTKFRIAVTGMTGSGTVTASIAAGRVTDLAGNGNLASTSSDNSVTYVIPPTAVTITDFSASNQGWFKTIRNWVILFLHLKN